MKILIDMNLTPKWVDSLKESDIEAVHWSTVGSPDAADREIMDYARINEYIVFTHDLDFGDILAVTNAKGPSVIQIRTQNTTPQALKPMLLKALDQFGERLETGALVTVDPSKMRARILPLA
jgi:predicted nuclease of predicted toxin-antitoxin system